MFGIMMSKVATPNQTAIAPMRNSIQIRSGTGFFIAE